MRGATKCLPSFGILFLWVSCISTSIIQYNAYFPGRNKFYRVTSILVHPYLMESSNTTVKPANETSSPWQGFLADYIESLAEIGNFNYSLRLVPDGKYGELLTGNKWNGLMGEVINNKTDIALAPLTVTLDREKDVDFTYPFETFQALIVTGRRRGDSSFYPRIHSLEDLVNRTEIRYRYGVRKNGPIHRHIKQSTDPLLVLMAASLERNLLLPSTNVDGLARAQDDPGFAFVVEESVVRLALRQPPCDLEAVPTGIYRRQYALAVRNGSPLRDSLNSAIVEMVDRGIYAKLVEKWWKENACSDGARIVFIPTLAVIIHLTVLFVTNS